jgi:reversibly glycosylated polypeptide / UDP-arabinopyranose mutase
MKIAVSIPTIRPERYKEFIEAWTPVFEKHHVELFTVWDGENPIVEWNGNKYGVKEIMGKYSDAIVNLNGGIRNLGFACAYRFFKPDIYITLDDDETPDGDPIQDHINALNMKVPVSWMSTYSEYMRGFPYQVREEAEVVLSHGVWKGFMDWDAPTQLVKGNIPAVPYKGVIPKGIYYPMCIMNVAFKACVLPWMYQTPPALGVVRAADMFSGVISKREIDKRGWAVVSGMATVNHQRASNVYKNLQQEAKEIELYETFWKGDESDPYFKIMRDKLKIWQDFLEKYV